MKPKVHELLSSSIITVGKSKIQDHKSSSIISASKKILFIVAFLSTAFVQYGFAQDNAKQSNPSQLLTSYYNIKNALVAGNANTASASAEEFVKTLNGVDYKVISEGNVNALLKDATAISEMKDINHQREHFAGLSSNMVAVAKAVKLSDQPIYEAYCPMKKAYWLSTEATIKNPYFGSTMLTCGKVVETLK
ncbi:MAG TPA: DUF3347 domain-containing protein [Chitinophagaceae bacterium]|nr:DUF3347 domain-containing protein [Chitinophagaceae bacterium]